MLQLDKLPPSLVPNPMRNRVLREFTPRQDIVPFDQRIDLPEIQDSFRVNFSDGAKAAASEDSRNVLQKAGPTDEGGATELKLRAYLSIAAL